MLFCFLLVRLGVANEIIINNMLPGHTKFICDQMFGFFKPWLKREFTVSVGHLLQRMKLSNLCVAGAEVIVYDWKSFLVQYSKPIPSITNNYCFRITGEGVQYKHHYSTPSPWSDVVKLVLPITWTIHPVALTPPNDKKMKGLLAAKKYLSQREIQYLDEFTVPQQHPVLYFQFLPLLPGFPKTEVDAPKPSSETSVFFKCPK